MNEVEEMLLGALIGYTIVPFILGAILIFILAIL